MAIRRARICIGQVNPLASWIGASFERDLLGDHSLSFLLLSFSCVGFFCIYIPEALANLETIIEPRRNVLPKRKGMLNDFMKNPYIYTIYPSFVGFFDFFSIFFYFFFLLIDAWFFFYWNFFSSYRCMIFFLFFFIFPDERSRFF